ncbi:MAG: superoxide dismutase [Candidatus Bathyarchaeota archaeon]|nr:superoxide dismutase [Candidatus Bathyarchaeota archaeon]MDH5712541.1 superoxide dismutase [Candidatus Bathyarchaeota archaeon]
MGEMYKVKPLPFAYTALDGISEQQLKYHHDVHYAAYVRNRNKIEDQLADMRRKGDFPNLRGLKLSESHNASGMILHEVYWQTLGGKGGWPTGKLAEKIRQDFGSFETWKKEFMAVADSARGWVLLCYDLSDNRLHVYSVDFHDQGAVWGSIPIMALDVWEHAFYYDQGPKKGSYFEAFFRNVNWERINENFEKIASKFEK